MIIRDPRPEAAAIRGTVVDQFSEHVDVLPTILHWLGATELPLQCDGHSLLPFLTAGEGAPSGWRTEAHWEYDWRDVTQSADAAAAEGGSPEEQMGLTMHQCGLMVSRCGGAERHGPVLHASFLSFLACVPSLSWQILLLCFLATKESRLKRKQMSSVFHSSYMLSTMLSSAQVEALEVHPLHKSPSAPL